MLYFIRGQQSVLIVMSLILFSLFQNCAQPQGGVLPTDDGIVHKIEVDSNAGVLSIFNATQQTEQGQDLLAALPANRPLVVLLRNGDLYPGVQIRINNRSFLVSDYLKLIQLYTRKNQTVPIFYSNLLDEITLDFGREVDHSHFCYSFLNRASLLESDLVIQIADIETLEGAPEAQVYWTLPLRIFSHQTCGR